MTVGQEQWHYLSSHHWEAMAKRPVQVLMVDDDHADIDLTIEALRDGDLEIEFHAVHDGAQCMAFLQRDAGFEDRPRPDVILLDLNMPGMDGHETLKAIRSDPAFSSMPVVILTTSDADEDIVESYRLNANSYVTKPVDLDAFTDVMRVVQDFWFRVAKLPSRS